MNLKPVNDFQVFTSDAMTSAEFHLNESHITAEDLIALAKTCPAKFRWSENADKEMERSQATAIAARAAMVNPDHFANGFYRMPAKEDYPEALTSDEKIKSWLKERGQIGYSKLKTPDLIAMVNEQIKMAPEPVQIWADITAKAEVEAGSRIQVNGTDFDNVLRMRETIANNPYLNEIISGGDYGVCLFGEVLGIPMKTRFDKMVETERGMELWRYRTSSDTNPEKYIPRMYESYYQIKMALDYIMFQKAFGFAPAVVGVLAQERTAPFIAVPFTMDNKMKLIGMHQIKAAGSLYKAANLADNWPSYAGGEPVPMSPPSYVEKQFKALWEDEETKS